MPFKPCIPATLYARGVQLGYAVRIHSKDKTPTVAISVAPECVKRLKWNADQPLRLDSDPKARLLRLTTVSGHTSKATRLLRLNDRGRGTFNISCSGDVALVFGVNPQNMTPLTIVEETSEGLTFEMPNAERSGPAARDSAT